MHDFASDSTDVRRLPGKASLWRQLLSISLRCLIRCFVYSSRTSTAQGLPALVRLLLNPATGHELVILAIDSIKAVLDMGGRLPRNDLCRTLVELELLELLVAAIHEVALPS